MMSTDQTEDHNPWSSIFDDAPPENPHQLYMAAAINAVGNEHGQAINELTESVVELIFDAIQTSANAALAAANVSNDWRAMLDARANAQPAAPCDHAASKAYPPSWEVAVIESAIDLYVEMSWTYQARERPALLCSCVGLTEKQKTEVIEIVDDMIKFALHAAGVDSRWDNLYEAALAKMQAEE